MAIAFETLRREMTAGPPQSAQSWYRIDLTILKAVIRYVQWPEKTIGTDYDNEITFQHAKHKCVNSPALKR